MSIFDKSVEKFTKNIGNLLSGKSTSKVDIEKSVERHTRNIEKLLSDKFTQKPDWDKYALIEIGDVFKAWTKGDEGAAIVLHKLVRGEIPTSNYHIGKLREFSLKAILGRGPQAIDYLLSLLRDSQGNLLFKKDDYYYWPDKVLNVLEDIALSGVETKRLAYEFISIGAKLDKMGVSGGHKASYALGNIKHLIYKDDVKALFSPPFPPLSEDEKDFLALRTYEYVPEETDSSLKADYDLSQLISSKSIADLLLLFNKKNRSDKEVLQALIGFIDDPRVPSELLKIFTEGAIRLDAQSKALALNALNQVQDQSFQQSSVVYPCEAIVDSSRTYKTSVEIYVKDLLVLKEIEYLRWKSFAPRIPLKKDVDGQRGLWFEVRDNRISALTLARGRGTWESTATEITALPDTMGNLTGMTQLNLAGQSELKTLPASLKDLKDLRINIERTGIHGS